MKKLMKKFALIGVLVALIVSVTEVYAQNASPTMTKEQVTDLVARVYDAPTGKFLLKQLNGQDKRSFRVVFVHNGKRYPLDHNLGVDGIQAWIRPNGTSHPNPPVNAFTDANTDGIVDSGTDTDGHARIFAVADSYYKGSAATGLEHRSYWQKIYDEMLAGLQATLR